MLTPRALLAFAAASSLLFSACDQKAPAPAEAPKAPKADTSGKFTLANLDHSVAPGGEVSFQVKPGQGFKINPEYPWSVTLEGSKPLGTTGLKMSKEQLDVDATRVKADVPLQPVGAGKHFLKGSANISVCETTGAKKCLLFNDEPVTLEIDAQKI